MKAFTSPLELRSLNACPADLLATVNRRCGMPGNCKERQLQSGF